MASQEQIEVLFAPFSQAITAFAQQHALQIVKCQRGNSGWELTRHHPSGGTLYLLLLHDETLGLGIGAVWQFPCSDTGMLYSHFRAMQCCAMDSKEIEKALARELDAIESVKFGYWTHMAPLAEHA